VAKRKALSKKARFDVFKRDGFVCQYCGAHPPQVTLHCDHIVAVVEGGTNDADNLVTACEACNLGKGARALADVPASLQSRAAEMAEREEQLRGYTEVAMARRNRLEEQSWDVAEIFMDQHRSDGINKDWFQSIRNFVDKLGLVDALDAMQIAVARKPHSKNICFKYFCGVCWNKIRAGGL
jgi:hypothetical protein